MNLDIGRKVWWAGVLCEIVDASEYQLKLKFGGTELWVNRSANLHYATAVNQLAVEGHGAVQTEAAKGKAVIVTLVGPVCHWWQPGQWGTALHQQFVEWRDAVRVAIIKAGNNSPTGALVYSPHRAVQGSWDPRAQHINDAAIGISDFVVNMTPPGVPAAGTDEELKLARTLGVPIVNAPPGNDEDLGRLLAELGLRIGTLGKTP